MKNFLNKYKYHLLICFIALILFLANYKPGTYLTGWDSLQTELNPGLAVKRALFSVWEEYQSLGLTAGMAHASDLVRAMLLWIMSFFLPQNMVRYFFHFLMLAVGGLGALELFMLLLKSHENKHGLGGFASFLGAVFYMLNLGTTQIFYLPFESFSAFFAFLPWGIWAFQYLILDDRHLSFKKNLLIFLLVNFLGTPAFYSQQLFVVYGLTIGLVSIGSFIEKRELRVVKKAALGILLILIINSFWILPQLYFLKSQGSWVTQSKANQIATSTTLYQNLDKGTLGNFLRLEGFYYDLAGIKNQQLFLSWKDHFVGILGIVPYLFAGLMLVGLFTKSKHKTAFLLLLSLCALVLLSATPPFSILNTVIRKNGFINQIFRSPFTKFIILYSLIFSFFVSEGVIFLMNKIKYKKTILAIVSIGIVIYALPSFQGYFISQEMKTTIPQDYFQVMNYFQQVDKNKRIALLPDYTFWGWFFTKWGYNGSGFIWYGIEQPIVSRTFDVWSPKSESYFWEVKQAIESQNLSNLESVFDKYDIDYLLLDNSLMPIVSNYKSLSIDQLENLLSISQKTTLIFKSENLALYQVNHDKTIKNFVSFSSDLKNIGPSIKLTSEDLAFQENGDYKTDNKAGFEQYYPFLDLTTETQIADKSWQIKENIDSFTVTDNININPNDYDLSIPQNYGASFLNQNQVNNVVLNLGAAYDNQSISVNFDKYLVEDFTMPADNQVDFVLKDLTLPQKYGYLVKVRSKNISGPKAFFYVTDETNQQSVIEERLNQDTEYFILPPKFQYGLGYSFAFQNQSYKNFPSKNQIEGVSIYLFPEDALKSTKFINKNHYKGNPVFYDNFSAEKINYFTYVFHPKENGTVILNQSFDDGWIAFSNSRMLKHIEVNNWSNGWIVPKNSGTVIMVFWPQYLEFAGLALLAAVFLRILFIKK